MPGGARAACLCLCGVCGSAAGRPPGASPCFPKTCCPPPVPDGLVPAGNPAVRLSDARLSASAPLQAGTPVLDGLIRKPSPICRAAPIRRAPTGGRCAPPVEFLRCPHSHGGKGGGRTPSRLYPVCPWRRRACSFRRARGPVGLCRAVFRIRRGVDGACLLALLARGILADSKALEPAAALGFAYAGHPAGMYPPRHASRGVFHTGVRRGRIGARRAGRASHGREGAR